MSSSLTIIACSIFKNELEQLKAEGLQDFEIVYLDSMLHMNPSKLKDFLNKELEKLKHKKNIILYGDCHSHIMESENACNAKVNGINCCEIFLGGQRYKQLRKEGFFILLPEWLERWQEVFQKELGFSNDKVAKKFMNDFHTGMVYIDTGITEIPFKLLEELSQFTGLTYRIEPCSTKNLFCEIMKTRKKLADD